jgi:psp operon transcriptional activator
MTRELGRDLFAGFAPDAMATLKSHDWPGNVRELRNAVERSVYRMQDPKKPLSRIVLDPFPKSSAPAAVTPSSAPSVSKAVAADPVSGDFLSRTRQYESRLLSEAMEASRFNQRVAATSLGLTYYQLRHYLKVHGLPGRQSGVPVAREP